MAMDGQKSDWVKVTSGVPLGSILGPLLFLVYVNDIGDDLESHTRLFADDCTLFREVSSKHDSCALQHDLTNLYNWSQKWNLQLNSSKCKVMYVSNKKKIQYQYHINNCR